MSSIPRIVWFKTSMKEGMLPNVFAKRRVTKTMTNTKTHITITMRIIMIKKITRGIKKTVLLLISAFLIQMLTTICLNLTKIIILILINRNIMRIPKISQNLSWRI